MAARTVILVDGVGTGVLFGRQQDVLHIVVEGVTFVKTRELVDQMPVYRLEHCWPWPRIRHINRYKANANANEGDRK